MFPFKYIHAHDCLKLLEFQDYVGGHSFGNILARPCCCLRLGNWGSNQQGTRAVTANPIEQFESGRFPQPGRLEVERERSMPQVMAECDYIVPEEGFSEVARFTQPRKPL